LKALIVTSPEDCRGELQPLTKAKLREALRDLRPARLDALSAAKHALRLLARRWQNLDSRDQEHDRLSTTLTAQAAPALAKPSGSASDVAAEMLIWPADIPSGSARGRLRQALRTARFRPPRRHPAAPPQLGWSPPGRTAPSTAR